PRAGIAGELDLQPPRQLDVERGPRGLRQTRVHYGPQAPSSADTLSMIDPDFGEVQCDKCMKAESAPSEPRAEEAGWLVDRSIEPHKHFCPACVAGFQSRRS